MSTKIGVIAEGPVDHALLPALLSRIADARGGLKWPTSTEQMDVPGERLSSEEVGAVKGIAADFHSLAGAPQAAIVVDTVESLENKHAALAARDAGRCHEAFELLRRCEPFLSAANLSYLRGTVWLAVGEEQTAQDFFQHAAKLGAIAPRSAIADRV